MPRKPLIFLLFAFVLTSTSSAAADFKIAVIDFKEFMAQSAIGESIQKDIKDKGEELKSELKKMQDELRDLQENYKRESPLWTQEKRKEKESSFRMRLNDFNNLRQEKENEFDAFRKKEINAIQEQIIGYAKIKAKKEGYDLILEKNTGTIIYADGSINITDAVVKDFDKKSKNGKKKE